MRISDWSSDVCSSDLFVGNVSYELRTPLTTIIGYSELLERSGENLSERGRGHAAAVRTAATQLARSIDDVLDMAQIDAGEMAQIGRASCRARVCQYV